MLRTISIGSSILIQGMFVKKLANGLMRVAVDGQTFDGRPVTPRRT
ncbi:hypothetical protein C8N43_2454 [Litoreibacter ponti]|uniref:Uncharacterized protein n=1 Tax=Litoreibacter ponti TaxID=1510457 RepID=A0A2T6BP04_9RHOB|nr:hypothetical protein C8N43_2454 [Litoreibacter ponti]